MDIINGLVSGLKSLLGVSPNGPDNVVKAATGLDRWIEKKDLTEAGSINRECATVKLYTEFMALTIKENSARSLTRRLIAIWIIRSWFLMLWISIFSYGFELHINATQHEFSSHVLKVATDATMSYLVLGVGAFFFGTHIIRETGASFKRIGVN